MSSVSISVIACACVFGGALLGMLLRALLPAHHLKDESKDQLKICMGLIVTMAALLLGLLVASAKSSFDTQKSELTEMSSKVIFVDRILAHYGPETKEARDLLKAAVARTLDLTWPQDRSRPPRLEMPGVGSDAIYDKIQGLSPKDEDHRLLQSQALSILIDLAKMRWLMFQQQGSAIAMPLLVVVIFWLSVIFVSFGLFAPPNTTVLISFFIGALSVSSAIFLIMEMDSPFEGLIKISSDPLRVALAQMGG